MARLYANENFPFPVVAELRHLGHDVVTMQDVGQAGQAVPDEQVLAFASAEGRAVLTLNRKHFVRLHAERSNHAGIVACTFDPDFVGQARRIDTSIASESALKGVLIRVNRPTP